MCGIAGFIDPTLTFDQNDLRKMSASIAHRGPDGDGHSIYDLGCSRVGLAHKRLSIIDLSDAAKQPMRRNKYEITFNGEIYNYLDIKKELRSLGHNFETNSDTEVALAAFEQWGYSAIQKFIGMFAIALLNIEDKELVLFRDRVGVKPLFFHLSDRLLFASELKAILSYKKIKRQINKGELINYLLYGYSSGKNTVFSGIQRVLPGSYQIFCLDSLTRRSEVYWSLRNELRNSKKENHKSKIDRNISKLINSATKYRLVSDVEIGVFLSGGYDSSVTTHILAQETRKKIKSFTIGFNQSNYDESRNAERVANYLEIENIKEFCTKKDAKEFIAELPKIYDDLISDTSTIPTLKLAKLAGKTVKVCISADGGDELFAGYSKYSTALIWKKRLSKVPFRLRLIISKIIELTIVTKIMEQFSIRSAETKIEKISKILQQREIKSIEIMRTLNQIFTPSEVKRLLLDSELDEINYKSQANVQASNEFGELREMMLSDFENYLPNDVLVKVDRATMRFGLEGREPLLDHRLIEYTTKLPDHSLINGVHQKWVLKRFAHSLIPENLVNRPKMGFGSPIDQWLREDLKEFVDQNLNEEVIKSQGILNYKEVEKIKSGFYGGKLTSPTKLWSILMFQLWYNEWLA